MLKLNHFKSTYLFLFLILYLQLISCSQNTKSINQKTIKKDTLLKTGAERTSLYLPLLKGKRVVIVANQTSVIYKKDKTYTHLVDSLLSLNVNVVKVFAPEHGFRGNADAGEHVHDGVDTKTRLQITSLYGKNKKPSKKHLENIDIILFDIQDVGARFYTYISTLHYVMEAAKENNIPAILLDRPNPNGHYIDGPVLNLKHKSFVGMHKVPIVYGMTIGEYGNMINGEKWLANNIQCNLTVIPLQNYTHQTEYKLPIKPSPNLPNAKSINLYPSLCLFEGTNVSIGRGTEMQFQIVGSPFHQLKRHSFSFTPHQNFGSKYPKHKDKICYGYDLRKSKKLSKIKLKWLIDFYTAHKNYSKEKKFFNPFFVKLAGTDKLQKQIEIGVSEKKIRASWQKELAVFKKIRAKYLIYK